MKIRPKRPYSGSTDLMFSCSGAADIADRAARTLSRAGGARVFCLALLLGVAFLGLVYARAGKAQTAAAAATQPQTSDSKVIAYYFHVTVRCATCRAIEGYSREVIEQKFGAEIAKGRLQYNLVNVQLPENKHFVRDYQLFTKSLVLVRLDKGKQAEYKVLNDTWELVRNKPAMQAYVERELREYLKRLS